MVKRLSTAGVLEDAPPRVGGPLEMIQRVEGHATLDIDLSALQYLAINFGYFGSAQLQLIADVQIGVEHAVYDRSDSVVSTWTASAAANAPLTFTANSNGFHCGELRFTRTDKVAGGPVWRVVGEMIDPDGRNRYATFFINPGVVGWKRVRLVAPGPNFVGVARGVRR